MKRLFLLPVAMILVIGLIFIWGCSDDDNDNGAGPTNQINPEDSTFVTEYFDEDVFLTGMNSVSLSWVLLDSIPSGAKAADGGVGKVLQGDDDIVITAIISYEYSEGWHIFEFEAEIIEEDYPGTDTIDVTGTDSVQVLEAGVPVQFPDEQTVVSGLKERAHANWEHRGEPAVGAVHHLIDVGLTEVVLDTIITFDGAVHDTIEGVDHDNGMIWSYYISYDQTIDSIQISTTDEECPLDGFISMNAGINATGVSDDVPPDTITIAGNWVITVTVITPGTIRLTYSDGTVSWAHTEVVCGGVLTRFDGPHRVW